jgi:hypothetical protein
MIRKNVRKKMRNAACALALTLCAPAAALACEGDDCPAPAKVKPLDIMQFMREQAASTRDNERRHHAAKVAAAKPKQATHHAAAAKPAPTPAPLESDAAASFASHSYASQQTQDELSVPVLAREEFNAVDNAASAPSTETTGASFTNDPNVQVVAAAEFNDIDRKAEESSPFPAVEMPVAAEPAKPEAAPASAKLSWMEWLWSAVTGTFTALVAAVRQLVHA